MKRRAQPGLGTLVEITLPDDDPQADNGFAAAFAAMAQVQGLMSFHAPDSDLARINRAPVGEVVQIDQHTWQVLECAEQLRISSAGVFDVACAAPLMASGYLPPLAQAPEPAPVEAEGAATQTRPSPAYALLSNGMLHKLRAAPLDLGGIAKGYAVDLAIAALMQAGVASACVNAGGDMRAYGEIDWPVWLRDPAHPQQAAYQTSLHNLALASSGRYFARPLHAISAPHGIHGISDGKRDGNGDDAADAPVAADAANPGFSHLLNGMNQAAVCADYAVSVCAETCMLADALCKVVFATGNAMHPLLAQYGASGYIIPA